MNLTKSVADLIIDRFKSGETIQKIAVWYKQTPEKIEGVIRKELNLVTTNYESLVKVSDMAMADLRKEVHLQKLGAPALGELGLELNELAEKDGK